MDCSDMARVEPSSEASSHLGVFVGLFPSLSKVIIGPYVLIHLLHKLFEREMCPWAISKYFGD
jgi:nitrate reductase NapE component